MTNYQRMSDLNNCIHIYQPMPRKTIDDRQNGSTNSVWKRSIDGIYNESVGWMSYNM